MEKIPLIAVIGPTASGKTEYACSLALEKSGEIVSGDSMQIYRGMNIGTAKPTKEEMAKIPHHLIDVADITDTFSVSKYVSLAEKAIEEIVSRGNIPIVAGGTGLYIDTLINGIKLSENESDPALRKRLFDYAQEHGAHALHEKLENIDPDAALAIHENNIKRVVRALEIFETTGKTKTELDRESRRAESRYDTFVIMLMPKDRESMNARIDRRVSEMFSLGLEREVRELCGKGLRDTVTASQAIGYKEFYPYFDGECDLDRVKENICLDTRHYAKRQLTWFAGMKKDKVIEV